jgi:hypothetical protein
MALPFDSMAIHESPLRRFDMAHAMRIYERIVLGEYAPGQKGRHAGLPLQSMRGFSGPSLTPRFDELSIIRSAGRDVYS